MKVKLKSDLPQLVSWLKEDTYITLQSLLTVGKFYEATFTPLLYNPITGDPFQESIIITCDDGYSRKFPLDYFITFEEYRDLQLEKILI